VVYKEAGIMRYNFAFIAIMAMGIVACGPAGSGNSPSASPGGTEVTTSLTETIHEVTGDDRSGPDNSDYDSLNSNTRGYLRLSKCGTLGLVFRKVEDNNGSWQTKLAYYEIDASGTGTTQDIEIITGDYWAKMFNWSLVFDEECEPHVYWARDGVYQHWTRNGSDWSVEDLPLDLEGLLGEKPNRVEHFFGGMGLDDKLHLIFRVYLSVGEGGFVHAVRDGGTWTATEIPFIATEFMWRFFDFVVDSQGDLHLGYNEDRHLYYAKLVNGAWQSEAVAKRGNFDQEAAVTATIALGPGDRPSIASTFAQRATTGSWQWMELRYYEQRDDGSWSNDTLITRADGYSGTDGNKYTGYDPHMVFDAQGRAHVAFNDVSNWHFLWYDEWEPDEPPINTNDYMGGQVRYLIRNDGRWKWYTLYTQQGQTESANPLHDMPYPSIAVSPDGGDIAFAAMERVVHGTTLRFDLGVEVDYKAVVLRAQNSAL